MLAALVQACSPSQLKKAEGGGRSRDFCEVQGRYVSIFLPKAVTSTVLTFTLTVSLALDI